MTLEKRLICVFYVYFFLKIIVVSTHDYEIQLDRMENIKGDINNIVNYDHLKITRKGSKYLINGNYTYFIDMDNSFSRGLTTAYSPVSNSRFIQQAYKFEQVPLCEFYNTTHKKYFQPILKGHSNFPEIPPEGLCPIPKGNYFAKDAILDEENFPSHMQRGLWRLEGKMFKGKQSIGGLRLFFLVLDKH